MNKPDNGSSRPAGAVVWKCILLEYHNIKTPSNNDTTVSGCIQNGILPSYIVGEKKYGTKEVCPNSQ